MVNQQHLSQNHLRQIGIGLHNYHDTELSLPLAGSEDPTLGLNMSWRVRLLPFIEQRPLHDVVKYDQPWDGEANAPLLRRMPRTYAIPPATGGTETSYLVFTAPEPIQAGNLQGTPMFGNGTGRGYGTADFSSVIDGTGNTIMIVEADRDHSVPWMKPADLPVDPANPKAGLGHARPGGFNVVMGDGTVRFIPNTIDNDTLLKLILRNDGHAVSY
jgi:hypothetical protein